MRRGLLGIEGLDRVEIEAILQRARDFQPAPNESFKRFDTLRNRMIVNLFFEASTRTRTSFEIAARRLGAEAVSIAASGSSVSKGESLVDTLNTLAAMRPNAIVMRHSASGAPHFLARHLNTPIINAGDGAHEHPTQALLDARTILDRRPSLEGLRVAIIGDIAHSRVARSNVHLLSKFKADIVLCGPASLLPPDLVKTRAGRQSHQRYVGSDSRCGRDHDAARPTGAAARSAHPYGRIFSVLRITAGALAAGQTRRPGDAPGAHQSRAGVILGGRRQPAIGDSESGGKRRRGADGSTRKYRSMTLLIRNGRILDPASGLDAIGDVLIDGGKIVRVGGTGRSAERLRRYR